MIQQSTSTPPPLPSKRKPGQPKPILLATYLETTFIPATTMSKAYSTAMRRAVCLFCEFAGDRLIGQIDSDMLLAFVKHLCAAGCVKSTADDYQLRIGRLVRHCCEGTISDLRKQPRINLSDVDWDDETLLQVVFKNRYLPEKISFRTVHTKNLYRLALRNLDEFLGRRARLADLTDTNIGGMMA